MGLQNRTAIATLKFQRRAACQQNLQNSPRSELSKDIIAWQRRPVKIAAHHQGHELVRQFNTNLGFQATPASHDRLSLHDIQSLLQKLRHEASKRSDSPPRHESAVELSASQEYESLTGEIIRVADYSQPRKSFKASTFRNKHRTSGSYSDATQLANMASLRIRQAIPDEVKLADLRLSEPPRSLDEYQRLFEANTDSRGPLEHSNERVRKLEQLLEDVRVDRLRRLARRGPIELAPSSPSSEPSSPMTALYLALIET